MIEHFAFPVISIIVTNPQDRTILLQRRRKDELYHDYWELPQGRLRQGETILNCAQRELYEETGLENFRITTQLTTSGGVTFGQLNIFSTQGEPSYFAIYVIGEAQGTPRDTAEGYSHKWMNESETVGILNTENVFPLNREMLKCFWKNFPS